MKKPLFLLLLILSFTLLKAQQAAPKAEEPQLKQYFFVMLSRGAYQDQDKETLRNLQNGHMAHMQQMANAGKLNIAGPFADNGQWRGIWIFKTESIEETKLLVEQDPMVKAGRLKYEIHPWWSQKGAKLD
ncbi:MAG: YciI family protein [Sphingobacteriaceae bacterium]